MTTQTKLDEIGELSPIHHKKTPSDNQPVKQTHHHHHHHHHNHHKHHKEGGPHIPYYKKQQVEFLSKVSLFQDLSHHQIQTILEHSVEVEFASNSVIYKRFEKNSCIYVIIEGEVIVETWVKQPNPKLNQLKYNNDQVQQIQRLMLSKIETHRLLGHYLRGQYFGDYELIQQNMQIFTRQSQATTRSQTKTYMIPLQILIEHITEPKMKEMCEKRIKVQDSIVETSSFKLEAPPKSKHRRQNFIRMSTESLQFLQQQRDQERFTPHQGSLQNLLYRKVDDTGMKKIICATKKYNNYLNNRVNERIDNIVKSFKEKEREETYLTGHGQKFFINLKNVLPNNLNLRINTSDSKSSTRNVKTTSGLRTVLKIDSILETNRSLSPVLASRIYLQRLADSPNFNQGATCCQSKNSKSTLYKFQQNI